MPKNKQKAEKAKKDAADMALLNAAIEENKNAKGFDSLNTCNKLTPEEERQKKRDFRIRTEHMMHDKHCQKLETNGRPDESYAIRNIADRVPNADKQDVITMLQNPRQVFQTRGLSDEEMRELMEERLSKGWRL